MPHEILCWIFKSFFISVISFSMSGFFHQEKNNNADFTVESLMFMVAPLSWYSWIAPPPPPPPKHIKILDENK